MMCIDYCRCPPEVSCGPQSNYKLHALVTAIQGAYFKALSVAYIFLLGEYVLPLACPIACYEG